LAKFKKKKSQPTEGSNDSKKELSKDEISDIPEIEGKTSPEAPSAEPAINEAERNEKDRKLNKLFWMRVALAIIAGATATFIFEDIEGEERRWSSIGFMVILFFGTIMVAKGMKMQLPRSDRKKLVTQGIGSYIFMYLFTWILTYTLVNAGSISNEIPSLIN
jgi:hypothetical protein